MIEIIFLFIWGFIGLIVGIWWFIDNWKWEKANKGFYRAKGITLGDVFMALLSIIVWPVILLFMSESFVIKKFK